MKVDPPGLWKGDYAGQYEAANYGPGLAGRVMRRSHELVEKPFGPETRFARVLEVGAGSDVHLRHVRHGFDEYWLTDQSGRMLEGVAPAIGKGVIVQREDATQLSFADATFDRVIAAHVLEHLYRPHEVLREWMRVLRPGGTLSLVQPCDPGLLWRLGRYFGPRQQARRNALEYDYVMAREHVNPIGNLVSFVRYYFDNPAETWWPTRLPLADLNLIYVVNIRK